MFFGSVEKPPRLSEFDLEIPDKLIAHNPTKERDNSKLMVLNREDESIQHLKFKDIVQFFKKGDVLVLNNTKVYPARLFAHKDRSDAKVEVFLLRELENNLWEAMVKPASKVRIGNKLLFGDDIICDVIDSICKVRTEIKWPNDILINNKKISGIISEIHNINNNNFINTGFGVNIISSLASLERKISFGIQKTFKSV